LPRLEAAITVIGEYVPCPVIERFRRERFPGSVYRESGFFHSAFAHCTGLRQKWMPAPRNQE